MVKRDKMGRVVNRVEGQYSDRVYGFRVTQNEYELIQHARKQGLDPREILLKELKREVKKDDVKT